MKLLRLFLLLCVMTWMPGHAHSQPAAASQYLINGNTVAGAVCLAWNGTTFAVCGTAGTPSTGSHIIVPLDIATVTAGGTAVTAINAGHRTAGGWIFNPIVATVNLCINEQGVASGTTSAGPLTCIAPGQLYTLTANPGAVSVITSDSAHPFSGMGYN